jgi:NAD(P)-dependent dehydrogenase (short-subunit alcohol dehydrogenase family)
VNHQPASLPSANVFAPDLLAGQVAIVTGGGSGLGRAGTGSGGWPRSRAPRPVLSIEWARFGVRMTAVGAAAFDTGRLPPEVPETRSEGVAGPVPLGCLGTEEEFAWLVAFPASTAGRRRKP